jgi:hypothetical protein
MRLASALIFVLLAFAPLRSEAFPIGTQLTVQPGSNVIEVAGRCGRYAHYVPGHHNRWGYWVRGHCERNYSRYGAWRYYR